MSAKQFSLTIMFSWLCSFCHITPPKSTPVRVVSTNPSPALIATVPKLASSHQILQNHPFPDRYQGEELQGRPHGNGTMMYGDGDYYQGEWVLGVKQGRGLQISQEKGVKYEGQFYNGLPEGEGKLINPDNSCFVGQFKKGLKHGKGTFHNLINNRMYEEEYSNGQLIKQVELAVDRIKEEEFPTLMLDKERFDSRELELFQKTNPEIKELDMKFLLKYYSMCKILSFPALPRNVKEWIIKEVLDFLVMINLKAYQHIFYQNKIKGKDMVNLTEKELEEDLKMKLGDRRRLLSYIKYLTEIYCKKPAEPTRLKIRSSGKKGKLMHPSISSSSYKRSYHAIKSNLYEQRIEELNEDSDTDRGSEKNPALDDDKFITQEICFPSNMNIHHSLNGNEARSFKDLSEKKTPASNCSPGPNSMEQNRETEKKSEKEEEKRLFSGTRERQNLTSRHYSEVDKMSKDSNESSSSTQSQMNLHRKKSAAISGHLSHQHMEIRQLYEFLREHRSLDFLIKEKDLEILQQIGQGSYGKVYKAKYIGSLIAVKDYMKTGKHRNREDFMKEVEVMSDLKHPNVVLYMGMCITANRYILITQYLENGSLFDQLHKKHRKFSEQEQIDIVDDIVKGMVYLHSMKNIIHRDLKSSNVLIGEDWKVKLCDFGLSGQRKKSKKKGKNRVGTYQWMAPEVIRNDEIDFFSDVYSFGIIIWELLIEKIPYFGFTEQQIVGTVGHDDTHELEEPKGNPFLVGVMKKCLKRKPSERPSFMEIQNELNEYLETRQKSN